MTAAGGEEEGRRRRQEKTKYSSRRRYTAFVYVVVTSIHCCTVFFSRILCLQDWYFRLLKTGNTSSSGEVLQLRRRRDVTDDKGNHLRSSLFISVLQHRMNMLTTLLGNNYYYISAAPVAYFSFVRERVTVLDSSFLCLGLLHTSSALLQYEGVSK